MRYILSRCGPGKLFSLDLAVIYHPDLVYWPQLSS